MKSYIQTTRFWLAWIFASLLVYPLVLALLFGFSLVITTTVQLITNDSSIIDSSTAIMDMIYLLILSISVGGIVGFAVGLLQKVVIRRYFQIEFHNWQRTSVVGGMIAASIMAVAMNSLTSYMSANYWQLIDSGQFAFLNTLTTILPMVLYVTILAAVQVVILRQYVMSAWLWILANTVAGLTFSMLLANAFEPGIGNWLLAAIAQGAVTGFAMLWLLHRLNREIESQDEPDYAYQHVPIETDDPTDPSIWDDAI